MPKKIPGVIYPPKRKAIILAEEHVHSLLIRLDGAERNFRALRTFFSGSGTLCDEVLDRLVSTQSLAVDLQRLIREARRDQRALEKAASGRLARKRPSRKR